MSRFIFGHADPIDQRIMGILTTQINIAELKTKKKMPQILQEDIIPLFPEITSKLLVQDYEYFKKNGIIDAPGNLLIPGGIHSKPDNTISSIGE